jgi:hypothetical protein
MIETSQISNLLCGFAQCTKAACGSCITYLYLYNAYRQIRNSRRFGFKLSTRCGHFPASSIGDSGNKGNFDTGRELGSAEDYLMCRGRSKTQGRTMDLVGIAIFKPRARK